MSEKRVKITLLTGKTYTYGRAATFVVGQPKIIEGPEAKIKLLLDGLSRHTRSVTEVGTNGKVLGVKKVPCFTVEVLPPKAKGVRTPPSILSDESDTQEGLAAGRTIEATNLDPVNPEMGLNTLEGPENLVDLDDGLGSANDQGEEQTEEVTLT